MTYNLQNISISCVRSNKCLDIDNVERLSDNPNFRYCTLLLILFEAITLLGNAVYIIGIHFTHPVIYSFIVFHSKQFL